jgi:hypothetical protein
MGPVSDTGCTASGMPRWGVGITARRYHRDIELAYVPGTATQAQDIPKGRGAFAEHGTANSHYHPNTLADSEKTTKPRNAKSLQDFDLFSRGDWI